MNNKFDQQQSRFGPDDDMGSKFDPEDEALWQLMGVLDDVKPSSAFLARVKNGATSQTPPALPFYRLGWVQAAAAVLLVALTIAFWRSADQNRGTTPPGNDVVEYQGVMELLGGLSDADVLVLEANETEIVQADWFGG